MSVLLALLLFLHVISAIVAFGPSFAFPLFGRLSRSHPQHAGFAMELAAVIERRIIIPVGLSMPVTGVAMIIVAGINPLTPWLAIAIVIYTAAILFAIFVQLPTVTAMGTALRELAGGGPPPAGAPAAPPPHIAALSERVNRGGMFLSLAVVAIVFLMVTKLSF